MRLRQRNSAYHPDGWQPDDGLLADGLTGLSSTPKRLPSKWFYVAPPVTTDFGRV